MKVDDKAEKKQIKILKDLNQKDNKKLKSLLNELKRTATEGKNIMEVSIKCAHGGVTTGEWSDIMREVYGEYRAPTGIVSLIFLNKLLSNQKLKFFKKK